MRRGVNFDKGMSRLLRGLGGRIRIEDLPKPLICIDAVFSQHVFSLHGFVIFKSGPFHIEMFSSRRHAGWPFAAMFGSHSLKNPQ